MQETVWGVKAQLGVYYDVNARFQINSGINLNLFRITTLDYTPRLGCDFDGLNVDLTNSWFEYR